MKSLAMAAAIVMLAIMTLGVFSLIVALRSPERQSTKIVATIFSSLAVVAGGWLMLLEVGIGARLIGMIVTATGVLALLRMWRT
jgi:hypothetical protein